MKKKLFNFFIFIIRFSLLSMEKDHKNIENVCLLVNLPIELIQKILFCCLRVCEDDLEAIYSFRSFANVLLICLKVDFIRSGNSREKYIEFFAVKMKLNPFYLARLLKIQLTKEMQKAFRKMAIEQEAKRYNLVIDHPINWDAQNQSENETVEENNRIFNFFIANSRENIIKLLMAMPNINLDANCFLLHGTTLLMEFSEKGDAVKVELLLKMGCEPNFKNIWGLSALMGSVIHNHPETVELLLKFGADVNIKNNFGNTPLFRAVSHHKIKIIELLLKNNADLNIVDASGNTALILAAKKGYTDIVRLLLEAGADINIKGEIAVTALNWAKLCGHKNVENLLSKK